MKHFTILSLPVLICGSIAVLVGVYSTRFEKERLLERRQSAIERFKNKGCHHPLQSTILNLNNDKILLFDASGYSVMYMYQCEDNSVFFTSLKNDEIQSIITENIKNTNAE